jgi:hypothetical protein
MRRLIAMEEYSFRIRYFSSLSNDNLEPEFPNLPFCAGHAAWYYFRKLEAHHMTHLLEKAFAEAAKLSEDEQDAVARFLLEELEAEREWDKRFAESQSELDQLAKEALDEHQKGQTGQLNPNKL